MVQSIEISWNLSYDLDDKFYIIYSELLSDV